MNRILSLSASEWDIISELLGSEARQLSVGIHHTTMRRYREQLRRRLDLVTALMDRMQAGQTRDAILETAEPPRFS
jgi:hypothetical protein